MCGQGVWREAPSPSPPIPRTESSLLCLRYHGAFGHQFPTTTPRSEASLLPQFPHTSHLAVARSHHACSCTMHTVACSCPHHEISQELAPLPSS